MLEMNCDNLVKSFPGGFGMGAGSSEVVEQHPKCIQLRGMGKAIPRVCAERQAGKYMHKSQETIEKYSYKILLVLRYCEDC